MKRRVAIAALTVGTLVLLSWLAAWLLVGGEIPRHTEVSGVEIGARSQGDAIKALESRFSADAAKPVVFDTNGKLHEIAPADLGATIDFRSSVLASATRPLNPYSLWRLVFSHKNLDLVIRIDQPRFNQAINDLAQRSAVSVQEGGIVFAGATPVAIPPFDGQVIDTAKAMSVFTNTWLRETPISLPSIVQHPLVAAEEISRVMREIAVPAMSAPITLVIDGHDLTVDAKSLAASMTFEPNSAGQLLPRFSSDELSHALGNAWLKLVPPARDATFKFVNDQVRVYPSSLGRTITDDSLTEALTPVLAAFGDARRAQVATTVLQPRISTQEIAGLGLTGQIAKFTTNYPYAAYRLQNIHRAADLIDGTVVAPGDTFSLNATVGQRTAENGFAEGIVIYNGRFAKDFGGGVSQVATTTWNAAWFAGVELIEHMAHSFYISRYPAGREATVAWPNVDLKFRNDTGHALLVHATYSNSSVTIALFGTRKYTVDTVTGPRTSIVPFADYKDDSPNCIRQDGVPGFDIDVTRVLKSDGVEVRREVFHTHYVPEDRVTCTNPLAVFGN